MKSFLSALLIATLVVTSSEAHNRIYRFFEPFMSDLNKRNWQEIFRSYEIATQEAQASSVLINGEVVDKSAVCTFKDISGPISADILDLVEQIKNPTEFASYGISAPKGILFVGAPGTGKTLMARAIAGETNSAFFHASGSEFIEMYVGVGAARVRALFDKAKYFVSAHPGKNAIIFIDEIDAIGGKRNDLSHSEDRQTLNELLNQMDGFKSYPNIILIAATNTADMLDSALKRSGRFDVHIKFTLPDHDGRVAVLSQYINQLPAEKRGPININELATLTTNCNNADLKNIVNYAAKVAMREKAPLITQEHCKTAIQQIVAQKRN